MTRTLGERFYAVAVDNGDVDRSTLPPAVADALPRNASRQVVAHTLQNLGDVVVDAKTVLTWLLAAVGAPASLVGLLVPIRDAGSMVPQVLTAPRIRRLAIRKWVWVLGAVLQAVATLAIALAAVTLEGPAAGGAILAALVVFALARSLSSFASKDVLGRTLAKGQRGQITGLAATGGGLAAVVVGGGLALAGRDDAEVTTLVWLLVAAAAAWVLAAAVFARVEEAPGDRAAGDDGPGPITLAVGYLRDDVPFRRFVVARSLLLVSALSPPFVVSLATARTDGVGLQGLGPFVLGNGIAALVAGRFWGGASDRSSRRTMMWAAGLASAVVLAFVALTRIDAVADAVWLYPVTYFLLAVAHTGSRVGRKTYVVDLADGNTRTDYIAVSNSAMGLVLLVTGALSAALATLGVAVALVFLGVLGVVGVAVSASLPEVGVDGGS